MAEIPESEKLTIVLNAIGDANRHNEKFQEQNEELLRRFNCELYGNETEGRSQYVSTGVKDTVNSDLPSLVRTFAGSNPVMKFVAANPNDEAQVKEAMEKTVFADYVIRKQPESYAVQRDYLQDIEVQKMGVVKYFFETTVDIEEREIENANDIALIEFAEKLTVGAGEREVEIKGEPKQNEDGTFDATFTVKITREKITSIPIPTESFLITENASSLDDAILVGDSVVRTRGELVAEGFDPDLVDTLPQSFKNPTDKSTLAQIRFRDLGGIEDNQYREWSNQNVQIDDVYILMDVNGDGISERRHIQLSGDVFLVDEPFNHVPYSVASAYKIAHRAIGEGRAEQVTANAAVESSLTRGMLDNIYIHNNPKLGMNEKVNIDDVLSQAIGGAVRTEGDGNPGQDIFPIQIPFIGDKTLLILQHMNNKKVESVGNHLSNQGLAADEVGQETAARFNGIKDNSEAKIELVARDIAEVGYRKWYEGVVWMATKYQSKSIEIATLGGILDIDPSKWVYDSHLYSEVGLGAGDNTKIVENMTGVYNAQLQLKAQGSPLVDDVKLYNTLDKLTSALELKDTSMYFNNPEEPEELLKAQNELLNNMMIQLQEQNQILQQQIDNPLVEAETIAAQKDLIEAQGKLQLERDKLDEDKRQFNIETIQKQQKQEQDTAVDLTKLALENDADLEGDLAP